MELTSLLVQMARALAKQAVPAHGNSAKAWRRSWMLSYCAAVVARVRASEEAAVPSATPDEDAAEDVGAQSAALVIADRSLTVRRRVSAAYPRLKKKRVTYSGSGYGDGYREGQRADIGGGKLRSGPDGPSAAEPVRPRAYRAPRAPPAPRTNRNAVEGHTSARSATGGLR